jgi:hypothetical protein
MASEPSNAPNDGFLEVSMLGASNALNDGFLRFEETSNATNDFAS